MSFEDIHYGGEPSATVQVEGDEKRHPCDWQIEGMARGLADWRIVAQGRLEVGAELRVTLRCQLGVLTGTAIADNVVIDAWGSAETTLRGHGGLTLAASEGEAVARCGDRAPSILEPRLDAQLPPIICALPAGHAGWHRDERGAEWGQVDAP